MLEKEIKILEVQKDSLIAQLESLGAQKKFEGLVHDVYYDFPKGRSGKMEQNGRIFRLRQKGEDHIYTIKRKRKDINKKEGLVAKEEHETPVTNRTSFEKILERYGLKRTREKKKYRICYILGNMVFEIDSYEGIPDILEIEGPNMKEIKKWLLKLNLENHTKLIGGSRKLFAHYNVAYQMA